MGTHPSQKQPGRSGNQGQQVPSGESHAYQAYTFFGQLEQSSLGTFGPEVGQFSLIALQWPTSEL